MTVQRASRLEPTARCVARSAMARSFHHEAIERQEFIQKSRVAQIGARGSWHRKRRCSRTVLREVPYQRVFWATILRGSHSPMMSTLDSATNVKTVMLFLRN